MAKEIIPESLRRRIRELPDTAGVYFFKKSSGEIVYIGKAVSIRKRVSSHFRFYHDRFTKTGRFLADTSTIDYLETPGEAEALLLEASLVKQHQPRYNQELKDDKSYPFLKITNEEYPRLLIVRGRKADGARYYGPYTSGFLLKKAVKMLRRQFPLRTCQPMPRKLCLMYHIGQCKGPCVDEISQKDYRAIVNELADFLDGKRSAIIKLWTRRMREFSERREYEKAKALYEDIRALSSLPSAQPMRYDPAQILDETARALDLPKSPRVIEAFDISNISGREAVGSMAVFVDGAPSKMDYRRFRIKTVTGIDDYRMMREVIRRRYGRLAGSNGAFPDLILIDGGKGHLEAARTELRALNLGALPIVSIAKQHEHIFAPWKQGAYVLAQNSPILQLFQRLRDEAHRFAVSYHRKLHRKAAVFSELDSVPGVGPATRERIRKRIGNPEKLKSLSEEDIVRTARVSRRVAAAIKARWHE